MCGHTNIHTQTLESGTLHRIAVQWGHKSNKETNTIVFEPYIKMFL